MIPLLQHSYKELNKLLLKSSIHEKDLCRYVLHISWVFCVKFLKATSIIHVIQILKYIYIKQKLKSNVYCLIDLKSGLDKL